MREIALSLFLFGCSAQPETVADACYEFASSLCARLNDCGLMDGTVAQCRTDGVNACCQGAICSEPITNTEFFRECGDAIRRISCGQLVAGVKPSECVPQTTCVSQCNGNRVRHCGSDGCGGSCGTCPVGQACAPDFRCVTSP